MNKLETKTRLDMLEIVEKRLADKRRIRKNCKHLHKLYTAPALMECEDCGKVIWEG